MSPNGWTDDTLCAQWFEKSFISQVTARRVSDAPILLILDGHGSHATAEMRKLALANKVHLFYLPPHTTHRLQPLDVGVFGPLQTAWQNRCNDYYVSSGGIEMEHHDFVKEYMGVRNAKFTEDLIKKAWRKCGITMKHSALTSSLTPTLHQASAHPLRHISPSPSQQSIPSFLPMPQWTCRPQANPLISRTECKARSHLDQELPCRDKITLPILHLATRPLSGIREATVICVARTRTQTRAPQTRARTRARTQTRTRTRLQVWT